MPGSRNISHRTIVDKSSSVGVVASDIPAAALNSVVAGVAASAPAETGRDWLGRSQQKWVVPAGVPSPCRRVDGLRL